MMGPPDQVHQLYDAWHRQQGIDLELNSPWHRLASKYLEPSRDIAGRVVLEIGCGRGEFACSLALSREPPRKLIAADFSIAALEKARLVANEISAERICWQQADIQALPFENNLFDTVVSCETIEHVPNPRLAVDELARVLKPGGRLILTTPNYFGSFGLYRAYLRCVGRPYTEAGQPINNVVLLPLTRRWIKQSGLKVIAIDSVGIPFFIPGRPPLALKLPESARWLWRWFGVQSCIVAEKPAYSC
jgi:2-polyprenyl-3-methyl-5-hydroxy-6-metoxy-1,4-benzoquinol methylase